MKRHLAFAWFLLGSALMLIPITVFLKTSASNSKSRPVTPGLARLGDRATVRAAGRGAPRINLADGREVLTAYAGDSALQQLLEQNLVQPLAMASGDFDEDGVPDLISAYAGPTSGVLTLHRGNVDAIYPHTTEANYRKAQGAFTDAPFLSPARLFGLPVSPDFIGAGDFDADGHLDLAAAARGGHSLYLLAGNGNGGFGSPESIELPGAVTAMKTGEVNRRDGLADVIVGIITSTGPQVLIFQNGKGALRAEPESFALPDAASDFALGQFDSDTLPDLAIAAGHNLMVVYGRDREAAPNPTNREAPRAITSRQSFPFTLQSLASGDFTGKPQASLAALSGDGAAYLLSASFKKQRTAEQAKENLRWKTQTLAQGTWSGSARLLKSKVSSLPQDDLLVIDSSNRQLRIIETGNREPSGRGTLVDIEVEDEPVAALPMRLNADAIDDLVILRKHNSAPSTVTTQSAMIFTVLNNADSSLGSLRQAIMDANTNPGADTIIFTDGTGPQTINLTSPLPAITEAVTIDGTSQPGFAGSPLIELNGFAVPAGGSGLSITSGNCTVRSLVINRFTDNSGSGGAGIILQTGGNNLLEGNFIGTNVAGSLATANFSGVVISDSSSNTVGGMLAHSRNVISGNITAGVFLAGTSTGNQIQGNFIGTDVTGTAPLGNNTGVQFEGVPNNTLGGTTASARNIISRNGVGVLIRLSSIGNIVQGNFIGTDVSGTVALANDSNGVTVQGSTGNTVGGTAAGAGNVISGNGGRGLSILAGSGNLAQGNFIGTNAAGTAALGNSQGLSIADSPGNTIGGTAAGARNIISGNDGSGITVSGNPATGNQVQGNFIGTDITGNSALANATDGILIDGASNNTIGGTVAGAGNLISGNSLNAANGIEIQTGSSGNQIQGNLIGTNAAGTAALPNTTGIFVFGSNNTIGGTTVAARNLISGNVNTGVIIASATGNVIQGNFIGTDITGTLDLVQNTGVELDGASNTTVGGTAAGAGNLISGNDFNVAMQFSANNNLVQGNLIGTNASGTAALSGSSAEGVAIGPSSTGNTIGGTSVAARNIISGHNNTGISLDATASNNTVQGNFIGTDITGAIAVSNAIGIVSNGSNNLIGGTVAGARNVISGNSNEGIQSLNGSNNMVQGNFIGTNQAGTAALPNARGILINSATNTTVGGTTAAARNVISGNSGFGVSVSGAGATGNLLQGNFIGTDSSGAVALGNNGIGVVITNGASNNSVGGAGAGAGNIIAFNNGVGGVVITGGTGNAVLSNSIFSNAGLGIDISDDAGITPNDLCDVDVGANNLQNFPVLTSASSSGGNTTIVGTLNSTQGTTFRIEFFSSATCDGSGNGEGQTFIGFTTVSTPPAVCDAAINVTLPVAVAVGNVITATATDPSNNTSEFSQCRTVLPLGPVSDLQITKSDAPDPVVTGTNITYTITVSNLGPDADAGVTFTDVVPAGTTFVSLSSPGSCSTPPVGGTGTVTCSLGALASGGSVPISLVVNVNAAPGATITNTAMVSGMSSDPNSGNNSATANTAVIAGPCTITCPPNQIKSNDPNQCGAVVTYPPPTTSGACGTVTCAPASGSFFPKGTTAVTCTTGAGPSCAFNVTVNDTQPPTITCPANQSVVGTIPTVVNYPPPTAADNCPGVSPACNPPSGSTFPVGTTPVTCIATDTSGNTASCTFTVTVGSCMISCPANVLTFSEPTSCGATVSYPSPTTSGSCGPVNCAPPSGSFFNVGSAIVTCTTGAGPSCSFTLTVADNTPPRVFCPANISTAPLPGQSTAVVNYPAATATDNCTGASVECSPPSGSRFPVGFTLVTCAATDLSSNTANCFFSIVVSDSEAPVIRCPANVTAVPPSGQTSAVVNYPPPTVTDNLPGVNVVCSPASGSSFPAGVTTVTCTATDAGGNKSSCGFTVSVGGAQIRVTIPGNKAAVEFAADPTRKAPKPKKNPCSFFTIENIGFAPLILTFDSIKRTGTDFTNGRIIDPNDSRFFTVSLVNSDQSLTQLDIGAVLTLQPGQSQSICAKFAALIPALAGKTTGLAASNILPDTLTSTINFTRNIGANLALVTTIPLLARVSTALVLVNLVNPKTPPEVSFTRSGDDITVSYAVFDSNLDVSRAKYEFLNANGQVVAGPFETDLTAPIRSLNLVKGQSFSVDQRFTGASSNPDVTGVRLTVFDGETSVSASASATSISAASIQLMNRTRRVTLYLPDVKLSP